PHAVRPHAVIARLVGGVHGRMLRGKRCALARAAEAQRTGALPRQRPSLTVRDRHDGIVEGSLNERHTVGNVLALLLLENLFLALGPGGRCASGCSCCRCFRHSSISPVLPLTRPFRYSPAMSF